LLVIRRTRSFTNSRVLTALLTCAVTAAAVAPAAGAADAPLPGPPPGAGSGFPLPPVAGQTPPTSAPGPAASIPAPSGPALADGSAQVTASGRLTLRLVCGRSGQASLGVAGLRAAKPARAAYACRDGHAAVRLRMVRGDLRRLARMSPAIGRVTLRQGAATSRLSVALATAGRSPSPGLWSDGGLQCSSPGPTQAYLVAPNFTVTPSTSIDVRPWIASYTDSGGWRWLGVNGSNASRWYSLTATPAGVAQWLQPTGALNPWTWGPIDVPVTSNLSALGVFEVVYWYGGRPTYVWRYTRSFVADQPTGSYCTYP
jgi:hypothetical protein